MSQHPYLLAVLRYWLVVLAAIIIGGLAGWGLSQLATPTYRASASLYFSISFGDSGNDLNQGSTYTQGQMLSYGQLAESTIVLQPVIDELGLDTTAQSLAEAMEVNTPANTVILEIVVGDRDPEQAAEIADEVAASLIDVVDDIAPRSAEGEETVAVRTIAPAAVPTAPAAPNTRLNVIAGMLIGLIVSILVIVLRRLLDTRVNADSVEELTGTPPLGTVRTDAAPSGGPLLLRDPMAPGAEDYRWLAASLSHATGEPEASLSVVVTSSARSEGGSTVAANLALALAEGGRRVVLVDANLRRPSLTGLAGLSDEPGLAAALDDSVVVSNAVRRGVLAEVDLLPSGDGSPEPGRALASPRMGAIIDELKRDYDVVIIDAPSLAESADAAVLAPLVSGVLLVADRRRAHVPHLGRTLDGLDQAGVRVFGVVLNHVVSAGRSRAEHPGSSSSSPQPHPALPEY